MSTTGKWSGLAAAVIVLVTVVVYIPAMRCGFIWDDDIFVVDNPLIKAGDGLYRFWFTTEPHDYFPLVSSSLWLEWRLWGNKATGYHVVNVLLHAVSAVLIWRVLRRLNIPGAWLAGLVFAVHPVNVEAVAWITQRKSTLPMVFYLLALLAYFRFESRGGPGWYLIALGIFLLALLSKTAVVIVPFILLGCAWWQRGRVSRADVWRSVPFFALSAVVGSVALWFQYNRAIRTQVVRNDGIFSRLAIAGYAVWFYLYKALVPIKLTFVYPRWEVDPASAVSYVPLAALIACFVLFWWYRRSWGRPLLAGLGYYVVALLPVLGFLNIFFMKYSLVADHWQYFALPGVIALVVGSAAHHAVKAGGVVRRLAVLCAVAVVLLLSALSFKQELIYKNEEELWLDTIAKNPGAWMAHYNLGNTLAHQERYDEAIPRYLDTLRLRPDSSFAHNNLGNVLRDQGKLEEAIFHYREALRLEPDNEEAHYNIGNTHADRREYDEAIAYYREALRFEPHYAEAHHNWGIALGEQGKPGEAMAHFEEALRLDPNLVEAHYNLGNVLLEQEKLDEAIAHYSEAVRLKPDYATAHYNLGMALGKQGRNEEAMAHFRTAVKLRPDLKPSQ